MQRRERVLSPRFGPRPQVGVVTGSRSWGFLPSTLLPAWGYLFSQSPENAHSFPNSTHPTSSQPGARLCPGVRGTAGCPPLLPALPASLPRLTGLRLSLREGPPLPSRLGREQRQGMRQGRDFLRVPCAGGGHGQPEGGPVGGPRCWRVRSHLTGLGEPPAD